MKLFHLFEEFAYLDRLFHGTTVARSVIIRKDGFSIEKQSEKSKYGSKLGVSFTTSKDVAKEHAEWAVKKFGGDPEIITINSSDLRILSGNEFSKLDQDINKAYQMFKANKIDAVEYCDFESGDGCEEFEVFIFNLNKIKIVAH